MKTKLVINPSVLSGLVAAGVLLASASPALAQRNGGGIETDRDIPGDSTKYYGQRYNQYRDIGRRLAKIDLDADFNYDGEVNNNDPADNGAFQQTPPGLVLGVGELSKLVIRLTPYHLDFKGRAVVSLKVDGINRGHKSGRFASPEEEQRNVGHIRVWRDASRSVLILDSQDPNRRVFEWAIDDTKYPANVPGIVPRTLYVEGVGESGQYPGDIRLLLTVQHRKDGATTTPTGTGPKSSKGIVYDTGAVEESGRKSKRVRFKRFSTAYDHILLTVNGVPHRKEYVNGNTSGVWKN